MDIVNLPAWITNPDKDRINMHEPFERQYWLREWGISEEQLQAARYRAGSSIVSAIYKELDRQAGDLQSSKEQGSLV